MKKKLLLKTLFYPVSTNNNGVDIPMFHYSCYHTVNDQSCWYFIMDQFVSCQSGTLIVGPRFSAINVL